MNILENLLPLPQEIVINEGNFVVPELKGGLKAKVSKAAFADAAISHKLNEMNVEFQLDERLDAFTACLCLAEAPEAQDAAKDVTAPARPEGYQISVRASGIVVKGADCEGLFWGLTTVEQMCGMLADEVDDAIHLTGHGFDLKVPCCEISDWPEIPVRGHFDDISRKRVSTTEDFKHIIRRLSRLKINYYGMYIEDVLHLRAYPDVGTKRGKLMPWEIAEIVAEGARYKVNIVPFFQLLGHCENLLDMSNYGHLGRKVVQKMSSLDATNPEVRVFLKNCIQEVAELFPCKIFGMGFDETQGLGKEDFVMHANWCAGELEKYGKTGLIWADMFYNHYGIEKIYELMPSLIPVDWQYDQEDGKIAFWEELKVTKRTIWGFGGYNNWCKFVPDFANGKANADAWVRTVSKGPDSALFYSQWGDNGYENNRDLPWNLFAYAGECSWRGNSEADNSFETRFHLTHFGEVIPALIDVVAASTELNQAIPYWSFHRKSATAFARIAKHSPSLLQTAQSVQLKIEVLIENLKKVKNQRAQVIVHHYITALTIMLMVAKRLIFAFEGKGLREIIDGMAAARDLSMRDWLLTNRLEGLEVSVDVFNDVIASYQKLVKRESEIRSGFVPVDLSEHYNTYFEDIAGVPIGLEACAGIPFLFADVTNTHLSMAKGSEVSVRLPYIGGKVKDLHLIVSTPMTAGAVPTPALRVRAFKDGLQFSEASLDAVTQCVDWFAPFGEHMWAGGGLAYADVTRVTPALRPDLFFGLMSVSGFDLDLDLDLDFDEIKFEALAEKNVEIFALTLEI